MTGGKIISVAAVSVDLKFGNQTVTGIDQKKFTVTGGTFEAGKTITVSGDGIIKMSGTAAVTGAGDFIVSGATLETSLEKLKELTAAAKITVNAGTLDLGNDALSLRTAGGSHNCLEYSTANGTLALIRAQQSRQAPSNEVVILQQVAMLL